MKNANRALGRALVVICWSLSLPALAGVKEGIEALAKRSFDEARREFEASASDPEALYQLGRMAQLGLGEARNESKAMEYNARAWEAGHELAGLELARGLTLGLGVPRDEPRGAAIHRKLAEAGVPRAQYLHGWAHEFGRYGLVKNEAAAFEWYRRAMEGGNLEALIAYARLLASGRGTDKDPAKAVELLKPEAARERPSALVALGRMYNLGEGVAKDEAEAFRLFKRAADLGLPEAQHEVGRAYLLGRGVARDAAEGARWIDAAARNGDLFAQRIYGEMYRSGNGVPANPIQAYRWLTIAFNRSGGNYAAANQSRATLAATMTTAQIEEANRQAALYRVEGNVRPSTVKLPELARGGRVEIGGIALNAPLPEGFVNAWEFAERTRRSRPNQDSWSDILLVALNAEDVDRMKMGLRVDELRVLEFLRYGGDDKVAVSERLFADMRKQLREAMEQRRKAGIPPGGFSESIVHDGERALLVLQTRAPTGERAGDSIGLGLLRLSERAVVVRIVGDVGTDEGQQRTLSLLRAWSGLLLDAN